MPDTGLVVLGAGGHAGVVIATATACGLTISGLFDDDPDRVSVLDHPVVTPIPDVVAASAIVAIGDIGSRRAVAGRVDAPWTRLTHPTAWVDPSAAAGAGTVVFAHAVVQAGVVLGEHVIVNTAATVDHDCVVGDFSHVGPGAHLGGDVRVGSGTLIGIGAVVIPGVTIGDDAIIGAGAVVTGDVPTGATVVGVPARPVGHR